MYTLKNNALEVAILDPIADQERFGTRYCTGGYIFQVEDTQQGPLLSGPTYPDSFNVFDGQGIPDAFNLSPLSDASAKDNKAMIIGIGLCDMEANKVERFCSWEVLAEESVIRMMTTQQHADYALELYRVIELRGRTVHSAIRLKITGNASVPIRWFPHPFYPQTESDELCRFNIPVGFPENDGFEMAESGFISRKNWPWKNAFQALDHDAPSNLVVLQKHPVVGLVAATCSYRPGFFPIWGNTKTFSWEPFLERTLFKDQVLDWWIDYEF
jgi:hypothetical protein